MACVVILTFLHNFLQTQNVNLQNIDGYGEVNCTLPLFSPDQLGFLHFAFTEQYTNVWWLFMCSFQSWMCFSIFSEGWHFMCNITIEIYVGGFMLNNILLILKDHPNSGYYSFMTSGYINICQPHRLWLDCCSDVHIQTAWVGPLPEACL